jgi:hypothetical protein
MGRARRPDPLRPACQARQGQSARQAMAVAALGHECHHAAPRAPIKGSRAPRAPCPSRSPARLRRAAAGDRAAAAAW